MREATEYETNVFDVLGGNHSKSNAIQIIWTVVSMRGDRGNASELKDDGASIALTNVRIATCSKSECFQTM